MIGLLELHRIHMQRYIEKKGGAACMHAVVSCLLVTVLHTCYNIHYDPIKLYLYAAQA